MAQETVEKKRPKSQDASTLADDAGNGVTSFANPTTECGRYWKTQFDVYRENTQREVKKLVLKQKAAKDFARDRDMRCAEAEDQLKVAGNKALSGYPTPQQENV